ncbi:MAG: hypothetical protein LBJ64_07325 [Deltaproteobacteria bacterium]|jgi:hypothetical protein|nr:hypothetical protein [Deltaproteobacteria bacterium]
MKEKHVWLAALTLPEWLNWATVGWLRLEGRAVLVEEPVEAASFAAVMNKVPDVSRADDGAFVVAELQPEWSRFQETLKTGPSSSCVQVSLAGVRAFFPVSDRGARLLELEAKKVGIILAEPKFEALWFDWVKAHGRARADRRGRTLVELFGLPEPDFEDFPEEIAAYLRGDVSVPVKGDPANFESTRAWGWFNAYKIFGSLVGDEIKKQTSNDLDLNGTLKSLKETHDLNGRVLDEDKLARQADELSDVIKREVGTELSVRLLSVVFHYSGLLRKGMEPSIESLLGDLVDLDGDDDVKSAARAAYFIGWNMSDAAAASWVFGRHPERFPVLTASEESFWPFVCDNLLEMLERKREKREGKVVWIGNDEDSYIESNVIDDEIENMDKAGNSSNHEEENMSLVQERPTTFLEKEGREGLKGAERRKEEQKCAERNNISSGGEESRAEKEDQATLKSSDGRQENEKRFENKKAKPEKLRKRKSGALEAETGGKAGAEDDAGHGVGTCADDVAGTGIGTGADDAAGAGVGTGADAGPGAGFDADLGVGAGRIVEAMPDVGGDENAGQASGLSQISASEEPKNADVDSSLAARNGSKGGQGSADEEGV